MYINSLWTEYNTKKHNIHTNTQQHYVTDLHNSKLNSCYIDTYKILRMHTYDYVIINYLFIEHGFAVFPCSFQIFYYKKIL